MLMSMLLVLSGAVSAAGDEEGGWEPLEYTPLTVKPEVKRWELREPHAGQQPSVEAAELLTAGWRLTSAVVSEHKCDGSDYVFVGPEGQTISGAALYREAAPPTLEPFGPEGVFRLETVGCYCCCQQPFSTRLAMPHADGVDVVSVRLESSEPTCSFKVAPGVNRELDMGNEVRYDAATHTLYSHVVAPECTFEVPVGGAGFPRPVEEHPEAVASELFAVIRFTPHGITVDRHRDQGIPESLRSRWDTAAPVGESVRSRPECPPVTRLPPPSAGADQSRFLADIKTSSPTLASGDDCLSYDATNLVDGRLDTSWQEAVDGNGVGEWLEFQFELPVDIASVDLATGFQSTHDKYGDLFPLNGRVTTLTVRVNGEAAGSLMLGDKPGLQRLPFVYEGVTSVRLQVAGVVAGSKWEDTALSEVRFVSP